MPVCVTNGIFLKNKKEKIIFILDNTLEEENVMSGNVSICGNIFGEISYMQMNTETQVGLDDIEELIGSMDENVRYIHNIIKKFVEEENKRVEKIIKSLKISEKKEDKEGNDIEYNENEEIKKNLKDKMDIEEKSEKIINILEYKK